MGKTITFVEKKHKRPDPNSEVKNMGFAIDKSQWKKVQLGDIAEDVNERVDNPSASEFEHFVGLEHFVSGDLKIKKWSSTKGLVSAAKKFKRGDVLFARRNAYLRRASLVEFNGVCSGDAFVLRENHNQIVPGFLAFIVNSNRLWDYANANAAGTMSKRVKWRDLSRYEFLLPPKGQQTKMSELLWAADEAIEKYINICKRLEELKCSFQFQKYNGHIFKTIGEVASKVGSGKTPLGGEKFYTKEGIPFLRSQNVLTGKLSLEDIAYIPEAVHHSMKSTIVQKNDVLLNITGASIGRSAVFDHPMLIEANVNQHVCIIRTDNYSPYVLCDYLNSKFGQVQIDKLQTAGNRQGLNFQNLRKLSIPYFTGDELNVIEHLLLQIIQNQSEAIREIQLLKSIRNMIINQIFN
jgi:type I restriction enzyme, S subunit